MLSIASCVGLAMLQINFGPFSTAQRSFSANMVFLQQFWTGFIPNLAG
jgi:hypothetical protein